MLNKLISLGLILGLVVGLGASMTGNEILHTVAKTSSPLGQIFINAVKMVVIPLVVSVIFTSIARLGDPKKLGSIGVATLTFYCGTLLPAIVIGMSVMFFGLRFIPEIKMPTNVYSQVPELQSAVDFIVSLIPSNPFSAASNGQILPLIVFTALLAAATGTLASEKRKRMVLAAEDFSEALIKLVWWILYLAPLGVFGLVASSTALLGWSLIQSLIVFILCVLIGLFLLLTFVFLPMLIIYVKMNMSTFFKGSFGPASIAFSTTSTAAAIPISLEHTVSKLNVSKQISDLLIPLGASIYRPGSALFQGAAIIFLAHIYGVSLSSSSLGGIIFATFLVSLTVAPVPSSGVVTMTPALATIGVPVSGLGLILGIDRIPDMMRSCVNLLGQIAATIIVEQHIKNKNQLNT